MSTATPAPSVPPLVSAPMSDRPGGEAEVGFRLATTGRKKSRSTTSRSGVQTVLQTRQVQKNEGELERPPARSKLRRRVAVLASLALPRGPRNGLVHRPECQSRVAIPAQEV